MKKITKSLLVAGLILPCAIGLAACGPKGPLSETAHCNTSGVYSESTLDEYNATIENLGKDTEPTGYRLTMDARIKEGKTSTNIRTNAIFVGDELMASMTMPGATINTYMTGSYVYVDATMFRFNTKTKYPIQIGELPDLNIYGDVSNFETLLDMIPSDSSKVEVSKITDENEERYRLKISSNTENSDIVFSDIVIYLNFSDGTIQEAKMTTKFTASIEGTEVNADMTITMSAYSEQLEFPDFSRYTEFEMQ